MDLALVILAVPRVGLGPTVSLPPIGPADPVPARQPGHGGRLGAYSTKYAPPFSATPGAETSVPPAARHPASPSSLLPVPPQGCACTAVS